MGFILIYLKQNDPFYSLYGESVMHFLDSNTFEVKNEVSLARKYFGEGCAVFTNKMGKKEIH